MKQSNQSAAASPEYAKCKIKKSKENRVRSSNTKKISLFCKNRSLTNPLLKAGECVLGRQLMILVLYDTCVECLRTNDEACGGGDLVERPFLKFSDGCGACRGNN